MLLSFMDAIKRRTIVRDLTVGLTVTIVLVTTTVSLLYYVSSTSTVEKRLKDQAMAHLKRLSYSLTTPLLNNDDVAILRTAWEYQRFYDIAVLRVFNADGDAIYDPNYTVLDPKITEETALTTATKSLHWYDLKVGSVEVSLKRKEIIEVQQITLYLTLMIMFSVILTVIAASSLLLKVFITRPLAAIAQGIELIADGSYDRVMAPVNRWDIDIIIEKINVMANQIAARDKRLRDLIEELKKSRDDLRKSLEETVTSLASTAEKRDPYTAGHQERVTRLAVAIAKEQGLPDQQIEGLHFAAMLHDIGKIALPAEYLAKPTQLSEVEKLVIQHHAEVGYDILKNIHFPWPVAEIVYQHHEHLDGSGYPRGLTDKEIHLAAKILAVADVVEAMSSHRPYRPSLGLTAALDEIRSGRGTLYHALSVDACLRLIKEKEAEFFSKDWCPLFL
jgi:putative nucleotidyltransferase with HDIG domain